MQRNSFTDKIRRHLLWAQRLSWGLGFVLVAFQPALGAEEASTCEEFREVKTTGCERCQKVIDQALSECKASQVEGGQLVGMTGVAASSGQSDSVYGSSKQAEANHRRGSQIAGAVSDYCLSWVDKIQEVCYHESNMYLRQSKSFSQGASTPERDKASLVALENATAIKWQSERGITQLGFEVSDLNQTQTEAMKNADQSRITAEQAKSNSDGSGQGDGGGIAPKALGFTPDSSKDKEGDEEEGFLSRNKDLLIGGAVGAGATCLLTDCFGGEEEDKKDESGKDGGDKNKEDGDGSQTAECAGDEDYKSDTCQDHYLEACQDEPNGESCAKFANHYCGLTNGSDATGGVVPNGNGPGTGSPYCGAVIKSRYCQIAGHDDCPTCVHMQEKNIQRCERNPSSCIGNYSDRELAVAQKSCSTDPLFSDPEILARIKNSNLGDGDSQGLQPRSTSSGVVSIYSTGKASSGGGYETFGVIGGRGPANEGIYRDVSESHGPSLFNKNSKVIQRFCQSGVLRSCSESQE